MSDRDNDKGKEEKEKENFEKNKEEQKKVRVKKQHSFTTYATLLQVFKRHVDKEAQVHSLGKYSCGG